MIRCCKCGKINDCAIGLRVCDGPSEAHGRRAITYSVIEVCPHCRSERIEKVVACDRCEFTPAMPNDDYCAPCARIVDAEEERDYDQELVAIEEESRHKPVRDLGATMRDIALGNPLRRAS